MTAAARPLKVGLVQMAMGEAPAPNLAKAIDGVRDAAQRGAQLIVLPELFRSRYFCQSEDAAQFGLAEAIPGPSTDVLGKLAAELKVTLVASLFEKRAAGLYHNTAAVLDAEKGWRRYGTGYSRSMTMVHLSGARTPRVSGGSCR
jgi:N-carbamoylputrescine amidase